MKLLLDLLQAAGTSAAVGIRPFLPALLYGALAREDLGVDFDGTPFAFLESTGFLIALLLVGFVVYLVREQVESPAGERALGAVGLVLGALEGAGTLDDRFGGALPIVGLVLGGAFAVFGGIAARGLVLRVRKRLDSEAQGTLYLFAEAFALLLVGLSVLFPPLALIGLAFLVFLLLGGKRREGEKYAGLRILR